MDRRNFLFLSGGAAAWIPLSRESSSAQAKSTEPVLGHPRLYFDAKRIVEIRGRIQLDPSFAARWRAFVDSADRLLKTNLVSETSAEKGQGDDANFGAPSHQIAEMASTRGLEMAWARVSKASTALALGAKHGPLLFWRGHRL